METFVIVLFIWTVAGLLAAIAFGKVIQDAENSPNDEERLPSTSSGIKYLRRNKRKSHETQAIPHAEHLRSHMAKRTAG